MTTQTVRKLSFGHSVARVISIIFHPIVLPLVTLLALVYLALGGSLDHVRYDLLARAGVLAGLAAVVAVVPVSVLVLVQVWRGRWTDTDVSVRSQRYLLYPFGIACMLGTAVIYWVLGAPIVALRATLGLAGTNVVNAVINTRYKVSAHATTASYCAALLWLLTPARDASVLAGPATAAALLVGWSRVALGRHTTGQVILGWAVGAGTGVLAALVPWALPTAIHLAG